MEEIKLMEIKLMVIKLMVPKKLILNNIKQLQSKNSKLKRFLNIFSYRVMINGLTILNLE
jgi:hypothetical protein